MRPLDKIFFFFGEGAYLVILNWIDEDPQNHVVWHMMRLLRLLRLDLMGSLNLIVKNNNGAQTGLYANP